MKGMGVIARARSALGLSRADDRAAPARRARRPLHAYEYFFVRGHPRSGTNWVGRLLNLHPRICCQGEYHFQIFLQALQAFGAHDHQLGSRPPVRVEARRAMHDLIRRCMRAMSASRPEATHLGDRTPSELRPVLPRGRAILVVRDGRDVLVSFTLHNLRGAGFQMQREPFASELAPLRKQFADDPELFRKHPERLLAHEGWVRFAARHWAARVMGDLERAERMRADGTPVLMVRYEDLHADVEAQRARMYEFLGLDPHEALPVDEGEDTTPGFAREEDPTALRRRGVVGDFLRYFDERVMEWFHDEASEAMRMLGYEMNARAEAPAAPGVPAG